MQATNLKQQYTVSSAQKDNWDYTTPGYCFVTICTKGFVHWFGEVVESKVILNQFGGVREDSIKNTENFRSEVLIYNMIIPNHVYIIIEIQNVETLLSAQLSNNNEIHHHTSLQNWQKNPYAPQNLDFAFIIRDQNVLHKVRKHFDINPQKWDENKYNKPVRVKTF